MKLVDIVKNNLKEVVTKHCTPGHSMSAQWIGTQKGHTISMNGEALRLLSETVHKIMDFRPKVKDRFTEKYVEDRLIDVIFSCHTVPASNLDAKLLTDAKSLLKKWQTTIESWIFFIPVVNLKLIGIKKISIGEVNFYDINLKTFKYLESKFRTRLGIQRMPDQRQTDLTRNNVSVLATVRTTAGETQKAKETALYKVESSLNILRLYDYTRDIGIQREFFTVFGREEIYYQNLTTKALGSSHGGPPPAHFFPYIVNKARLQQMRKKLKLLEFSKLLLGIPSTKLAKKIAMSIYWYGLGVKDKNTVDRFVKLIVALESLLLEEEAGLKKQTLADRAAFILGSDKKTREKISQLVEKMYSIRGGIVHEGKYDVSEEDTLTLMALVEMLIFKMVSISKRLQSLKDIDQRISEIKFGSQIRGF